jgi:hypothetical protein
MADKESGASKQQPYWVIYLGILIAGLMFLAEALHYYPGQKLPAKLAAALIYSAFALWIGGNKPSGYIGTVVVWAAVIVSLLV